MGLFWFYNVSNIGIIINNDKLPLRLENCMMANDNNVINIWNKGKVEFQTTFRICKELKKRAEID